MLTYNEALEYIHGLHRFGTKLGLENITKLLDILGNPHHGMNIIHVAGTNGKGSVCAMVDSILREAGYKVGLYTSPYLEVFNERMKVNGQNIADDVLADLTQRVKEAVDFMRAHRLGSPTEFEVVTATGFLFFREQKVDFLVLEVGMGGRLDATNVCAPLVSAITPISYDHQQYLGHTLTAIAGEKCGIIKPSVPVVSGPQEEEALRVIEQTCARRGCSLTKVVGRYSERASIKNIGQNVHSGVSDEYPDKIAQKNELRLKEFYIRVIPRKDSLDGQVFDVLTATNLYKNLNITLLGHHQLDNAATALGTIEALQMKGVKIGEEAIYSGFEKARWPGRLEIIKKNPTVLIDGAHNIAGIKTLKDALERYFPSRRKILVLGILKDKDYKKMIKEIVPLADIVITTAPDNPRALSAKELGEAIKDSFAGNESIKIAAMKEVSNSSAESPKAGPRNLTYIKEIGLFSTSSIEDAVKYTLALATPDDAVIFAGSLYMIGAVRTILRK